MTTSYTGIYIQKTSDGLIHSAQVIAPGGHSLPLDPQVYIERNVQPPIDCLPTQEAFSELERIHREGQKYPIPESPVVKELVGLGYLKRVTQSVENEPGTEAVVGHELTVSGTTLLGK